MDETFDPEHPVVKLWEDSLPLKEALRTGPPDAKVVFALGVSYLRRAVREGWSGFYVEAVRLFGEATRLDPSHAPRAERYLKAAGKICPKWADYRLEQDDNPAQV